MLKLIEKIKNLGWDITVSDNKFCLKNITPAGQNFDIQLEARNTNEFIEKITKIYDDFDVSYESYLRLDEKGHSKNGAPYNMKDVCKDMEACEDMIRYLVDEIEDEYDMDKQCENYLEELLGLREKEQNKQLTEEDQKRYIEIVEFLHKKNVEIPFGIVL